MSEQTKFYLRIIGRNKNVPFRQKMTQWPITELYCNLSLPRFCNECTSYFEWWKRFSMLGMKWRIVIIQFFIFWFAIVLIFVVVFFHLKSILWNVLEVLTTGMNRWNSNKVTPKYLPVKSTKVVLYRYEFESNGCVFVDNLFPILMIVKSERSTWHLNSIRTYSVGILM